MKIYDFRTSCMQFLIDFGEEHMCQAQYAGSKRASKYGNRSWQWKIAIWQEMFWHKFQNIALGGWQYTFKRIKEK